VQPVRLFDAARVQLPCRAAIDAAIAAVLDSGRFVLGPAVSAFEDRFARYCGVDHAIGVGNGSDALELALRALGVGQGSTVVTVANAGGYATTAIRACGASACYLDVDGESLLVDFASLAAALAERPAAVVVTHLYGRLAPIERIVAECSQQGVSVIEDCAQAHGAERGGRRAGSFGQIGCFSFYPTKNLGALGDGGALVTGDPALAARVRALRQYGWSAKYRVDFDHGRNSRLDELQAAILSAKLPGLDQDNQRRRAIVAAYDGAIRNPQLRPLTGRGGSDDVGHLYVLRCPRRDALRAHLAALGIDSDVHYPRPDHLQPAWRQPQPPALPATEAAAAEVLSLPCHPALTNEEVARVIDAGNAFR
jgi:dTDP-4-amino-4,6-dideoxygalactose transaminase